MRQNISPRWQKTKLLFSVLILLVLVFFTYGILFRAPYSGFAFGTGDGQILAIFAKPEEGMSLQLGDILVRIGDVSWEDYKNDSSQPFFENIGAGQIVEIDVIRNGNVLTIPWKMPGYNRTEFNDRFFNVWWLAYIFWFFGSLGQLLVRPRGVRRRLFITANYLTAFWLIFGSFSATHLWGSALLLRFASWLLLPVYLHLHWEFPRPFKELPKAAWIIFYAVCLFFAVGSVMQLLPGSLYGLAFVAALVGSIILEGIHFINQPDQRRDVLMLAISMLVAFVPSIGLALFFLSGAIPQLAPLGLLALPFMPLAYFYVFYRRQLGGLEVRVNHLVSLYAFLILFGTAILLLVAHFANQFTKPETWAFLGPLFALFAAVITAILYPAFRTFVEKRLYGIKLPYQKLQETYSGRITTSVSMSSLLRILDEEVFPSLLVREYVFMQVLNGELKTLLAKNVDAEQLLGKCRVDELTAQGETFFPDVLPCGWVRLILPLKMGDRFIGFWLLGRRDPDDHYPQGEIPILQSLANQTAIALSNIQHAEQVRKMYQSDIERNEKERMRLALELHDSVLNELAVLRTNLDEASLSPQLQTSYETVTHRLREIVSDLRPPMLMYGLVPAVTELADNLMERNGDRITIRVDIREGNGRLPQNIEQHLFRIIQEACENSLRHAQAKKIVISGEAAPHKAQLDIEDNGTGFDPQTELGSLIANQHFGLAGMVERANLIGAEINIASKRDTGTKVSIVWKDEDGQALLPISTG